MGNEIHIKERRMVSYEELVSVMSLLSRIKPYGESFANEDIARTIASHTLEEVIGTKVVRKEDTEAAYSLLNFSKPFVSEERIAVLMEQDGPGANIFRNWVSKAYPNIENIMKRKRHPEKYAPIPPDLPTEVTYPIPD